MTAKKKGAAKAKAENTPKVEAKKGEDRELLLSRVALNPVVRHASTASSYASSIFGGSHTPEIENDVKVLREALDKAQKGDKSFASEMLAAQAVSLDAMFTELARRAGANMGEYMGAMETYMRLALKAQANCRATLEALSKLHQPREQTVKHVHVNEGGQAVVADQFHQHQGEGKNGKTGEQSHATGAAGESPAMLGQDANRNGVPIPGRERPEKMPDARRDQSGRA